MCIFIVRKVDVTFSSVSELRSVCTIGVICSVFDSVCLLFLDKTIFVVLGYYQYVTLIGLVGILYLTALQNILQTMETSQIIPFSLTQDCLDDFESAII